MLIDPPISIIPDSRNFPTIMIEAIAEECTEVNRFAHGHEVGS